MRQFFIVMFHTKICGCLIWFMLFIILLSELYCVDFNCCLTQLFEIFCHFLIVSFLLFSQQFLLMLILFFKFFLIGLGFVLNFLLLFLSHSLLLPFFELV